VANDQETMRAIFCDPEVMQFSDHGVRTPEFAQRWVNDRIAEYGQEMGFGTWAVALLTSPLAIGYVGLNHSSVCRDRNEAELGFRLARAYWAQGYGLAAARLGMQHAFAGLGLGRVVAKVDPSNVGSIAIVERLGMQFDRLIAMESYAHPDHLYVCTRAT
jgi:RimJ/RimL family protein N-acetyltransferase